MHDGVSKEEAEAEPPYPTARAAALRIEPHLARHIQAAGVPHPQAAPQPDAAAIETIVNAGFWASLRPEEGRPPTISLAFAPPSRAGRRVMFERLIPLAPDALARLAPAVERSGIHLGVWRENGASYVWGTTRALPPFCFVLEVVAPGLLVVKQSRGEESGKFVNVAVLEGDRIKVLDHDAALPDAPALLTSLLAFDAPASPHEPDNILARIAVSMRAHHRGGSLLVVPAESRAWLESMVLPIRYRVSPLSSELADIMLAGPDARREARWHNALRRSIDALAGLTAVDGATVITERYELLAFGAKIGRRDGAPRVEQVMVTEPVEDASAEIVPLAEFGGTRHLSAAQFVQDQRDAIALVASQDGRFTLFAWSNAENLVHAHRLEALLL
ncbi:MAG: hypothetical protein KIT09_23785 [Bryobacteraceae bacterium]|nr:hypothetical protein [Bryobacteraceae bacterium]